MVIASILWRRLDTPGHDACRLQRTSAGWRLEGAAVFEHEGMPAQLTYQLMSDRAWRSREASVRGWLGTESLDFRIARTDTATWTLDGGAVPGVEDCVDLDFGFTPATNLVPVRRLALEEGQAADAPAAWLDIAAGTITRLPQRYERRTRTAYWYEAPTVGYRALLEIEPSGFSRHYPDLWEAEAAAQPCSHDARSSSG